MNQQLITQETLSEIGIDLNGQDVNTLLSHINSTLQERIGAEISETLDDEQLKALLSLKETASEDEVSNWLDQNVPELKQIAQDEIDILLGELADNGEAINEAAK